MRDWPRCNRPAVGYRCKKACAGHHQASGQQLGQQAGHHQASGQPNDCAPQVQTPAPPRRGGPAVLLRRQFPGISADESAPGLRSRRPTVAMGRTPPPAKPARAEIWRTGRSCGRAAQRFHPPSPLVGGACARSPTAQTRAHRPQPCPPMLAAGADRLARADRGTDVKEVEHFIFSFPCPRCPRFAPALAPVALIGRQAAPLLGSWPIRPALPPCPRRVVHAGTNSVQPRARPGQPRQGVKPPSSQRAGCLPSGGQPPASPAPQRAKR